jgi:hypothetical protein
MIGLRSTCDEKSQRLSKSIFGKKFSGKQKDIKQNVLLYQSNVFC